MGAFAALPSAHETDWVSAQAIAARAAAPTPLAPPTVTERLPIVQVHAGVDRLKSLVDQLASGMKLGGRPKRDRPRSQPARHHSLALSFGSGGARGAGLATIHTASTDKSPANSTTAAITAQAE